MGDNPNWPNRDGTAGGVAPDGHAVRRADGWSNNDSTSFGTAPAAANTASPRGGGWVQMPWGAPKTGPYTARSQRKR
jgi:hypothetical protein